MKLTPGLIHNACLFDDLSSNPGMSRDWEILEMLPKTERNINNPWTSKRNIWNLTRRVWNLWEKVVQLLLPENSKHTWAHSAHDFHLLSQVNWDKILLELKTAQTRNRWVIRKAQIEGYMNSINKENIYFSQLFYRTRNGLIPSKIDPDDFENQFFPVCMYIFPVSFILYLTNSVQACGNDPRNRFYALTQFRASILHSMVDWLNIDEVTEQYISRVFTTVNLPYNPAMQLYIVDHRDIPHLLGNQSIQ